MAAPKSGVVSEEKRDTRYLCSRWSDKAIKMKLVADCNVEPFQIYLKTPLGLIRLWTSLPRWRDKAIRMKLVADSNLKPVRFYLKTPLGLIGPRTGLPRWAC
jgi:hypothetical protein